MSAADYRTDNRPDSRGAWSRFWSAGGRGPESGCLPNALKQVDAAQAGVWRSFARSLPRRARVLDLGTGDGAVLGKLKRARDDLKLVGVDSSPVLPPAPKGMTLKPGVAMENLPFAAASFDAVTSQFGFEYGQTDEVAREIGRVLTPGGSLLFVVHHADGPILEHNLARLSGLAWAVRESGLLDKARALARARAIAALPTPVVFRNASAEAKTRFPGQSVADEFVRAILETLERGRGAPPGEVLDVINTLEDRAANEIARIEALARAVCGRERLGLISEELGRAGIAMAEPAELGESARAHPFAWRLAGRRTANAQSVP